MTVDCLKLTAYFGERQRSGSRFYADALLDTFAEHELATSILLRGMGGFGRRHHLRTDQTLTMSEDPPLVAIGVDTTNRIQSVVTGLEQLNGHGLFTLERTRQAGPEPAETAIPPELNDATKLTVYVGRQQKAHRIPAFVAVCDLLYRRGFAGASVLVGVDGTAHHLRQRAHFFDSNNEVPTMIIAVASGDRIVAVLPELRELVNGAVMTAERVRVCKRDGQLLERPHLLPALDNLGLGVWQKVMVHTSESALHQGEPVHRALVRRLSTSSSARGVTVLRGIWGFHGAHKPHGDKLFQLGRHVPVVTAIVDTPQRITECFDIVDEVTSQRGLVTTEMVPALLSVGEHERHGGLRLASHDY